jgi:hypothetical protein
MSDWKRPRDGRPLGVGTMVKDDTPAAGIAEVSVDRGHRADRAVLPAVVLVGRNLAVVVDRGAHVGEMGRAVIVPAVLCPTCCDMIAAAWAACS